jgi:excisionase family DNA binding protein
MNAPMVVGEAARVLGCTPENVRKLEQRGVLTCIRTVGGYRLFDSAEVQRVKLLRDARPTKWHPIGGAS